MAQRKTLTEKQVAVLRWIADGCPAGVMPDEFHRISAAALRSRGLVNTSGRGPTWNAKITSIGREYLRDVGGADPPVPRQANVSVTQQLVDDVIAAGGSLRVPRKGWYDRDGIDYENRARLAERYRKVPAGKRLEVSAVGDELEISLADGPHNGAPAELVPIRVPENVGRYHAAARAFRDRSERHEVSRELLPRATRILHAIAVEADRRGWSAAPVTEPERRYGRSGWRGSKHGHLQIDADDHGFWLRLQEEGVHTRGPWEEEVDRYRNVSRDSSYYRDRKLPSGAYDADASGRLKLELFGESSWMLRGRQSRWADRQSWTLEERLPHLFREIQERIVEAERVAEERRIAAEKAAEAARREAQERERQWHVLMDRARERLLEAHRAAHLRAQTDAWQEATRLRSYCDALEAAYGEHPDSAPWLTWARQHADHLDPLTDPPTMPEPPEATSEALQEHLPPGWSAYGPERAHHMHRPVYGHHRS
jgi:hypothetical protein